MLSEGVTLLKLLPSSQVDSAEQRFVIGERTLSGNLVAPPPRSPEPPDPPVPPDLLHSPLNRTSTHPYRPFRSMNTQLDRYVPNLALRVGSPPLQDWCSNVEILVEENVSRLVSLQYSANQSFEDWLLIVKVWVVISFVDVQPFFLTSGGLSTRFIYEIRRHHGVEAKLNQICLAGRVYCSTVLAAPCFSIAIHVDLLPTGNDNTTTASISVRRSIHVSISIMCALQRFSLVLWTTTTSPTGRGEFDLSLLSGEQSENDWRDIPLSKTLYWNFKSKFRHFRPSGHCYGVSQLLTAMLSDLFEIHIVSSESSRECWREDELLSRYTDYFAKALSGVAFPWVKMFNESPNLSTLIDVSLSHIPQSIYGTTRNWMNMPPVEVGMFVALAIVLHCKPEALTSVLPTLREDPKYQGHDKLPLTVWMIAQAAKGD
ncbi:hypothetical protein Bca52824_075838 [Brassica carinata]|uniref:Uncharacterized protein n=1 Tax=Brassica carinata TaxID=52824 RepID=A0A8X7TWQ8_BRACI|nr:hypothetical protein Bca52824_075838 [Brassica carinata]